MLIVGLLNILAICTLITYFSGGGVVPCIINYLKLYKMRYILITLAILLWMFSIQLKKHIGFVNNITEDYKKLVEQIILSLTDAELAVFNSILKSPIDQESSAISTTNPLTVFQRILFIVFIMILGILVNMGDSTFLMIPFVGMFIAEYYTQKTLRHIIAQYAIAQLTINPYKVFKAMEAVNNMYITTILPQEPLILNFI